MIEVDDRLRPDLCAQFLPSDQFSWPRQQHRQQLKGLLLQGQTLAMLRQLAESRIGFKNPKAQTSGWVGGVLHSKQIRTRISPAFGQPVARARDGILAHHAAAGSDAPADFCRNFARGKLGMTLPKYLIWIGILGYRHSSGR